MDDISPARLSELVGKIYDCTIDPDRWPDAMKEICQDLDCVHSVIILVDLVRSRHTFFRAWNTDPYWMERQAEFSEEMTSYYRNSPRAMSGSLDDVLVLSRDIPLEMILDSRYYQEWAKPQGICDTLNTIVLRHPDRMGVFAVVRHESTGFTTDREIALLRLLAPHIRRAVTISDVIDLKALEVQALTETLDKFSAGVTVVAENNRILHANIAARGMFASGGPVRSVNGRLSARNQRAQDELARAVKAAQRDEADIGAAGIGVALGNNGSDAAVAHVLPLARGDLRTRLVPQATAAVFVTQPSGLPGRNLKPISESYGLTAAEMRLLELLAAGTTLTQAAKTLAIAGTTAKTHLAHIFSKTGVSRQSELMALISRLSPPIGPSIGE